MPIILRIDRALYEVDDETQTYRFLAGNKDWKKLTKEENERNKMHIDGYSRIMRNGKKKKFKYKRK